MAKCEGGSRSMQVPKRLLVKLLVVASLGLLALACAPKSRAQSDDVAGQYVCSEARVAGKSVACTAPPLSLKSDGKFELKGREGEYLVSGNWVELNGTVLKSRAKGDAANKMCFGFPKAGGPRE